LKVAREKLDQSLRRRGPKNCQSELKHRHNKLL
jgi:hypothetical protein